MGGLADCDRLRLTGAGDGERRRLTGGGERRRGDGDDLLRLCGGGDQRRALRDDTDLSLPGGDSPRHLAGDLLYRGLSLRLGGERLIRLGDGDRRRIFGPLQHKSVHLILASTVNRTVNMDLP